MLEGWLIDRGLICVVVACKVALGLQGCHFWLGRNKAERIWKYNRGRYKREEVSYHVLLYSESNIICSISKFEAHGSSGVRFLQLRIASIHWKRRMTVSNPEMDLSILESRYEWSWRFSRSSSCLLAQGQWTAGGRTRYASGEACGQLWAPMPEFRLDLLSVLSEGVWGVWAFRRHITWRGTLTGLDFRIVPLFQFTWIDRLLPLGFFTL